MALMRSPPGVPIPVPQYRRSRSLYEWPGLAGSPGDAILSAVKWVYDGGAAFDEAFDRDGDARAHYRGIVGVLESFTQGEVSRRERLQKLALMDQGITFTVYGEKEGLTTRRSLSTRSSRARWGRRSWSGATSSSRTTTCSCARRAGGSAWTSSTAASTRTSSIRSCSGATACSACRACST